MWKLYDTDAHIKKKLGNCAFLTLIDFGLFTIELYPSLFNIFNSFNVNIECF